MIPTASIINTFQYISFCRTEIVYSVRSNGEASISRIDDHFWSSSRTSRCADVYLAKATRLESRAHVADIRDRSRRRAPVTLHSLEPWHLPVSIKRGHSKPRRQCSSRIRRWKSLKYLRNAGFNLSIDYRKISSIDAIFQVLHVDERQIIRLSKCLL